MPTAPLIAAQFEYPIDIVGDIRGEIHALRDLLQYLSYSVNGEHPDGWRVFNYQDPNHESIHQ